MISLYEKADYDQVVKLGTQINENFVNLFKINNLPVQEKIYVYKEQEEVFGFIHVLINIDVIEILNLVVDDRHRRQGIASLLIDYLLSETTIDKMILEVRASNNAAIKLYRKFNFGVIHTRKNYYGNSDALVMERSNL